MSLTIRTEQDHVRGDERAKVTLIEYGDFQCPYCARAHAALAQIMAGGDRAVKLVYRHLPLADLHPDAQRAAEASEAAAEAGKFWEMHDALFAQQDALGEDALCELAASLGVEREKIQDALLGQRFRQRVDSDAAQGRQDGARQTPTFFINGTQYEGDSDAASLTRAIDEALARAH